MYFIEIKIGQSRLVMISEIKLIDIHWRIAITLFINSNIQSKSINIPLPNAVTHFLYQVPTQVTTRFLYSSFFSIKCKNKGLFLISSLVFLFFYHTLTFEFNNDGITFGHFFYLFILMQHNDYTNLSSQQAFIELIEIIRHQQAQLDALSQRIDETCEVRKKKFSIQQLEENGYLLKGQSMDKFAVINLSEIQGEFQLPQGITFSKKSNHVVLTSEKKNEDIKELKETVQEMKDMMISLMELQLKGREMGKQEQIPLKSVQEEIEGNIERFKSKLGSLELSRQSQVNSQRSQHDKNREVKEQLKGENSQEALRTSHCSIFLSEKSSLEDIHKFPDLDSTKTPKIEDAHEMFESPKKFVKPCVNIPERTAESFKKEENSPLSPIIKKPKKNIIIYIRR